MSFEKYGHPGKCEVCGKESSVVVVASTMGPLSFACCKDCLSARAEPYEVMVASVACVGRFPDDINESYQEIVRFSLAHLSRTEEEFVEAVECRICELDKLCTAVEQEHVFVDPAGGWHECGLGWNPDGVFCGECAAGDCSICGVWERKQQESNKG